MIDYVTIAGTIALTTTITLSPISPSVISEKPIINNSYISIQNEMSPYNCENVVNIEINDNIPLDDVIEISTSGTILTELCKSKKVDFEWF